MRRITFISFTITMISLLITIIYGSQKNVDIDYYTIIESKGYIYEKDRSMVFNIYSKSNKSDILFYNDNYYSLTSDDNTIALDVYNIEVSELNGEYVFSIYSYINNPFNNHIIFKDALLIIRTSSKNYEFKIGDISIFNPNDISLLSFKSLYASYSYINNELYLTGINIILTNEYSTIGNIKISDLAYGNTSLIQYENYNYEIDIINIIPSYSATSIKSDTISLKGKKLFIPIGYKKISLITKGYITLSLDDQMYYIDTFPFINNIISKDDYPSLVKEGLVL